MRFTIKILFGLILISLFACEGSTTIEKKIVNDSSYQITFNITYKSGTTETFIVDPNTTVTISNTEEVGGKSDIGGCTEPISQIRTIIGLGRTLTFDPSEEAYWKKTSEKTKKIPSRYLHVCSLTVEDTDIQ